MKKVFYSIGLVSVMLFTACSSEDRGTSTEVADANTNENVDPATINDYDQPGTASSTASADYTDATYQQHAQQVSDQMANDLQLDDATATEVTRIYYERNRDLGELEQGSSFSATERMGGRTNETGDWEDDNLENTDINQNNTATTDLNQNETGTIDRTRIDENTDRELRSVLSPEQYRQYEQNRDRYNNMQINNDPTLNNDTGINSGINNNTRGTNTDRTNTGTGTGTGTGTDRPTGGNQ